MIRNTKISFLHEQPESFEELIIRTSNYFKMDEAHIEKDYWISRILKQLMLSKYSANVFFKGGTCLFKAYDIIKRFSEDLDLYIDTNNPESGGDPERKLNGEIFHFIINSNKNIHQEDPINPDVERGLYNRTSFLSNQLFDGSGLKRFLQIETTISSIKRKTPIYQPYESKEIMPIIGKYLEENGRNDLVQEFKLDKFNVNCIRPEKTLCDKISRLLRISFENNVVDSLAKCIRDVYDIQCIMNQIEISSIIGTKEFEKGLILTLEQDRLQHKYPHINQDFRKAIIFFDTDSIFSEPSIKHSYKELEKLLYNRDENKLPPLTSIITTIKAFQPLIEKLQNQKINQTQNFTPHI